MTVLINAASANMGGSVTYLKNVLRWIPDVAPDDRFVVYLPSATRARLAGAVDGPNIKLEAYPYADSGGVSRMRFDQITIPRLVRSWGADVLFSSTGFGTFVSPCPEVLLVRNMAYFDEVFHARYRELGRNLRRNTIRRLHSLASIRRSDFVLFPTEAIRQKVGAYVRIDDRRSAALLYGFDHEAFFQRKHSGELTRRVDAWRKDGYRILLNVSTFAVQKNYETLVEALAQLARAGTKVKLLLTIAREKTTDKREYDALLDRASELGVRDDIMLLGHVPYEELGGVYEAADLYVFPSFSESFGHSLVEAMASDLPIVAADTPVNREVCGQAGCFFSSFDPQECARAIQKVLSDDEEARLLAARARERACAFSWRRYTEELVAIFRRTAALPARAREVQPSRTASDTIAVQSKA
ncbi:MAG TPA: glycosyltransferase family 1 protein [Rhodothermales bacterium]|nr:glycosyltransferase family 1 protein [Rhodothermales bacterium]